MEALREERLREREKEELAAEAGKAANGRESGWGGDDEVVSPAEGSLSLFPYLKTLDQ